MHIQLNDRVSFTGWSAGPTVPLVIKIQDNMLLTTEIRHSGEGKFMNDCKVYDPRKLKEKNANYMDE